MAGGAPAPISNHHCGLLLGQWWLLVLLGTNQWLVVQTAIIFFRHAGAIPVGHAPIEHPCHPHRPLCVWPSSAACGFWWLLVLLDDHPGQGTNAHVWATMQLLCASFVCSTMPCCLATHTGATRDQKKRKKIAASSGASFQRRFGA